MLIKIAEKDWKCKAGQARINSALTFFSHRQLLRECVQNVDKLWPIVENEWRHFQRGCNIWRWEMAKTSAVSRIKRVLLLCFRCVALACIIRDVKARTLKLQSNIAAKLLLHLAATIGTFCNWWFTHALQHFFMMPARLALIIVDRHWTLLWNTTTPNGMDPLPTARRLFKINWWLTDFNFARHRFFCLGQGDGQNTILENRVNFFDIDAIA